MKQKNILSLFCQLSIIFSFLLSVPAVQAPNAPIDILSKITKCEIADLLFSKPLTHKVTHSKKMKGSSQTKLFAKIFHLKDGLALQNKVSSKPLVRIHSTHFETVLARGPPRV